MSAPTTIPVSAADTEATFRAVFEHAPFAAARCDREGKIVEMNPALERTLAPRTLGCSALHLQDLVRPQEWEKTELLLRDLFAFHRDRVVVEAADSTLRNPTGWWTVWRESVQMGEPEYALMVANPSSHALPAALPAQGNWLQSERWEAVGRLAGGVVHDFNNLLTGVMLYCDLLLSSLDGRDCRRRYADEIRTAIMQATGLVGQLLVFARPKAEAAPRLLSINEIVRSMASLLARLIGENVALELKLDSKLALVQIDQAQAQQVLLNLVLNARDALPSGGRITVETSNCRLLPVAGTGAQSAPFAFPCVLLVVGDNGVGMSAETRQRLFEPFFTTKSAGKGTGLGLTTIRSIVTTNRGLIHIESEPGRGTRAMVLLPGANLASPLDFPGAAHSSSEAPTLSHPMKKELPI